MERNTSTQFLKMIHVLDQREFHEHSKLDHALAQIAYGVSRIEFGMFSKTGATHPKYEDFLVKFKERGEGTPPDDKGGVSDPEKGKGIEIGEDELNEQWQVTNAMAKARWGALLGEG